MSHSESRYEMSNARKAQAAAFGGPVNGAREKTRETVRSRQGLANTRREVACPTDGDTVSQ